MGLTEVLKGQTEPLLGPESRRLRRRAAPSLPPGGRFCSGSHPNFGGRGGTIKRLHRPWLAPARGRARPCVVLWGGLGRGPTDLVSPREGAFAAAVIRTAVGEVAA